MPAGLPVAWNHLSPASFSQKDQVRRVGKKPRSELKRKTLGKAQERPRKQGTSLVAKGTQECAPGRGA